MGHSLMLNDIKCVVLRTITLPIMRLGHIIIGERLIFDKFSNLA